MPSIPVYIQSPEVSESFFTDWSVDDLDSVIPLLNRWGVTDSDGDDLTDAVGEFVVGPKRIIFRVSIGMGD